MQQFASSSPSRGSVTPIRGLRAFGDERPLRASIDGGERLLVCATVRFADRASSQPLWLTNVRFMFTRSQRGQGKVVISVPIASSSLEYSNAAPYPLHLSWTDPDGSARTESFRAFSWKDSAGSSGSAGVSGGATGGVVGALVGIAIDTALEGVAGKGGIATRDQKLYSTLLAAQRAPGQVRPIDLTSGSLNTPGGRWLIGGIVGVVSALLVAAGVFALVSYQAKQAYEAAPVCSSAAGPACRLLQPARVTGYRGAGGKNAYCDLFLTTAERANVEADLHAFELCAHDPRGRQMLLEHWRGTLTGVIPVGAPTRVVPTEETADNPEYNWRFGAVMTGILGLIWVIFGSFSLVIVVGWIKRRTLLRASASAAGYLS